MPRDERIRKMEPVSTLLKAVRVTVEDDGLTGAERALVLREVFDDYRARTGRDGLADIAAVRGETRKSKAMNYETVDRGALANLLLEYKTAELRKAQPNLTYEQAFSQVFQDPSNIEIRKAERETSLQRISGFPKTPLAAEIIDPDSEADIARLIEFERKLNPFLSDEELYRRIALSEPVLRARANFTAAMQAARRAGREAPSPQDVEVAKRDDAMAELRRLADELRARDPSLTVEGAFEKVYRREPALAARERQASHAALYA
jgi:hypothetical protein